MWYLTDIEELGKNPNPYVNKPCVPFLSLNSMCAKTLRVHPIHAIYTLTHKHVPNLSKHQQSNVLCETKLILYIISNVRQTVLYMIHDFISCTFYRSPILVGRVRTSFVLRWCCIGEEFLPMWRMRRIPQLVSTPDGAVITYHSDALLDGQACVSM